MRGKIASITQRLFLPSVCVLCKRYHRQAFAVCELCTLLLKPIHSACRYCAQPLPDAAFLVCGLCIKEKPAFDNTFSAYLFEEPLRCLLHEFKYQEALYLCSFLGKLMLDALPNQASKPECLVPVPLHPKRLRKRGFNQAAELAKWLAQQLQIPCELDLCKKIIHTVPQASLNSKQRKKNLHKAFKCQPTSYQHVTLVDDLLTTGSTANELAKVLKHQGVLQVDLWCCAKVAL